MEQKIKVIALFGPSGCGKDTLAEAVASRNDVSRIVTCTTRPRRDYEQEGINYYFLTNENFTKKVLDGTMLEATSFNDWFYGTPIEALDKQKINIGVFNKQGIECLLTDNRIELIPIYIACEDKIRLLRSLNRESTPNCEEICRRFLADQQDFETIDFEYLTYYNGINIEINWFIQFLIDHDILSKNV